ncbi:hypothetical protein GCM10023346_45810 [Arthrobacter gyeryongensis]|uniref:Uncharacterized protein n=1 Tax=Arthrobacter gyeryongensis TaxID=1650592 RepID=A0ABP9SSF9_9MICC
MNTPRDSGKSGDELYEIVLSVEELLGGELSGEELAELVNAADPPKEEKRNR